MDLQLLLRRPFSSNGNWDFVTASSWKQNNETRELLCFVDLEEHDLFTMYSLC